MKFIRYQTTPAYHPGRSFTTLRDEIDRLFEAAVPVFHPGAQPGRFPLDLFEDKDAFLVKAELPGFRREEIELEVADGALTITGYHRNEAAPAKEGEKAEEPAREVRVRRAVSLPEQVNIEKIAAQYENGVLTVTLPKREEVKPRQVAIEVK